MTAIINTLAVAYFFETVCYGIFEHLLATGSKDKGLLDPISTYFGTVETNSLGMLHLHCLVLFCSAFHITQLCKELQADSKYIVHIVEFIDCIIRCSIISENKLHTP